jgi:hypothetical protein
VEKFKEKLDLISDNAYFLKIRYWLARWWKLKRLDRHCEFVTHTKRKSWGDEEDEY